MANNQQPSSRGCFLERCLTGLAVAATGPTSRRWALATLAGVWLLDESVDAARPPRRRMLH